MLWRTSGVSMITWTVEALEYDDTNSNFPKRVTFIHLKAKHSAGPVHTLCYEVNPPQEGETYTAFEDITEEWAMNLWRSIDLLYGATTEDYLNELADSTERGQEIPWT